MNRSQHHEENPPAIIERRDTHGRTLDEAMAEDRARRQVEWERRLQRAYRPFVICDALMTWPPAVTVLLMGAGIAVDKLTQSEVPARLGLQMAAAYLVVLLLYVPARFTLLRWWMRERLDDVKAGARADGVTFSSDPLAENDRHWFGSG